MAKKLELKGCPLCGHEAYWQKGDKKTYILDMVRCLDCGLEIEAEYEPQSALRLWNCRVADYYIHNRLVNIEGENL